MRKYSGTTSFTYEIYRGDDDNEVSLQIEGRAYYAPGRYYGPPENCYPDESEVEITSCIGPDGKDWEDQLTESEKDQILEIIQDNVASDEGPDPDDYYDNYEDREVDYYD